MESILFFLPLVFSFLPYFVLFYFFRSRRFQGIRSKIYRNLLSGVAIVFCDFKKEVARIEMVRHLNDEYLNDE